ncbi:MAG: SIS domain-containing protein [Planctomycetota bacterium]|jgi:D-sedoheptulose 7-phosphate isomerase|nr:SIS domain-containing protein [Planctomycetota bacterium]|tara:strand:+ start:280 stop:897 length:618 start_codon:yes stop_codon:yes gene_type:complete
MLGASLDIDSYFERCSTELHKLNQSDIKSLADSIFEAYQTGACVFICGNGGSGANASHFCEDLGKSTLRPTDFENDSVKRLKVLSLTDNTPYILAWANDEGYDRIFVEQLKNLAGPDDVLVAISGSGNSPNVLRAVDWANKHNMKTCGITGFDGGLLRQTAGTSIHVPLDDMGLVESIHLVIFHWILDDVYGRINLEGRHARKPE